MNWHLIAEIGSPVLALLGVILAPLVGASFGRRAANANADAAVQDAFTRAYEAASKNWVVYTDVLQRWNEKLAARVTEVEHRLEQAELRNAASELEVAKANSMYKESLVYLRRVLSWNAEHWPLEIPPKAPPQIEADLLYLERGYYSSEAEAS